MDNPIIFMAWRKVALLMAGLAGGLLAAVFLCVSVESTYKTQDAGDQKNVCAETTNPVTHEPFTFPARIPGTTLIAEAVSIYEGPFLEDGSDEEVTDIAALLVRNAGSEEIIYCYIELKSEDSHFAFLGERIPPGATVLLLEYERGLYEKCSYLDCRGWQITAQSVIDVKKDVVITERSFGMLQITNTSDKLLWGVRIFYKSWLSPPDVYVGGMCYSVTIPLLLPGQTETLSPNHYACGFSKVTSVTAEQTETSLQ